jgi:hypothetical protein
MRSPVAAARRTNNPAAGEVPRETAGEHLNRVYVYKVVRVLTGRIERWGQAKPAQSNSACSSTVMVAFSCLSGG